MSLPSSAASPIVGAVARGRAGAGLYRARVRARGTTRSTRTPALVTQANPATSYPILRGSDSRGCEIRAEDAG